MKPKYSNKLPTEPGFYWCRSHEDCKGDVVEVYDCFSTLNVLWCDESFRLDCYADAIRMGSDKIQWSKRLEEPE